jgi:hypothetical protein
MIDEAPEKIVRNRRLQDERVQRKISKFDRRYAAWLRARAKGADHEGDWDEEEISAHLDRLEKLAREITMTPARDGWQIFKKLEVLEAALNSDGDGTSWSDNRELAMLGAIRADLLRFTPTDSER